MGDQTSTQTNSAGPQSAEARRMMALLARAAESGGTDALQNLAEGGGGNLTANQRGLITDAQGYAGDAARSQQALNYRQISRQLEDKLIGRGMDTSTIGAVEQATLGQQQLADLNQVSLGGQATAAEQMVNVPLQGAQNTIGANQALLQRLVGTAGPVMDYDALMRQLTSSSEMTEPFDYGQFVPSIGF